MWTVYTLIKATLCNCLPGNSSVNSLKSALPPDGEKSASSFANGWSAAVATRSLV